MKILKFGGRSLSNGEGLQKVISIMTDKVKNGEQIAVVVSARGKATDELEEILEFAAKNGDYKILLEQFKKYQLADFLNIDFSEEFQVLDKLFEVKQLDLNIEFKSIKINFSLSIFN